MPVLNRGTLMLLLVVAAVLTGCANRTVVLVTDGAPMDLPAVERLAKEADLGPANGIDAQQAPEERTRVLAELRTRGEVGDRAATLLTTGFPERTAAIPVLVRAGAVDGRDSIIVVEAYASSTGQLTRRRLWVFDAKTGAIIRAASYQ